MLHHFWPECARYCTGRLAQISLGLVPWAEVSCPLAGRPEALIVKGLCQGDAYDRRTENDDGKQPVVHVLRDISPFHGPDAAAIARIADLRGEHSFEMPCWKRALQNKVAGTLTVPLKTTMFPSA